jgi:hypothetical protein
MMHQITEAVAHPEHTVTVTWSDGARATVSFAPFLAKGGVFDALKDPAYFTGKMRVLPGGHRSTVTVLMQRRLSPPHSFRSYL